MHNQWMIRRECEQCAVSHTKGQRSCKRTMWTVARTYNNTTPENHTNPRRFNSRSSQYNSFIITLAYAYCTYLGNEVGEHNLHARNGFAAEDKLLGGAGQIREHLRASDRNKIQNEHKIIRAFSA